MPRRAKPLDPDDADRFFARVLAARLECPRCGWLDEFKNTLPSRGKPGNPLKRLKGKHSPSGWNPLNARWSCPSCRMVFIIGLLAWPVSGGGQAGETLPRDQVLHYRQLAQMRAQGGGQWMRKPLARHRAAGGNITALCVCPGVCVLHPREGGGAEGLSTSKPTRRRKAPNGGVMRS